MGNVKDQVDDEMNVNSIGITYLHHDVIIGAMFKKIKSSKLKPHHMVRNRTFQYL